MSSTGDERVAIYPFHGRVPGMPDLFHVRCDDHLDFGFCGEHGEAAEAKRDHLRKEHA